MKAVLAGVKCRFNKGRKKLRVLTIRKKNLRHKNLWCYFVFVHLWQNQRQSQYSKQHRMMSVPVVFNSRSYIVYYRKSFCYFVGTKKIGPLSCENNFISISRLANVNVLASQLEGSEPLLGLKFWKDYSSPVSCFRWMC